MIHTKNHKGKGIVSDIKKITLDPSLAIMGLDKPVKNTILSDKSGIEIFGWVIGKKSKATLVEFVCNDQVIHTTSINHHRLSVSKAYPKEPEAINSGFRTLILDRRLLESKKMLIQFVLEDKSRVPGYAIKFDQFEPDNSASLEANVPPKSLSNYDRLISQIYVENPYNGFDFKQYKMDLQGWNGQHKIFAQMISKVNPKIIIEIGVWKGQATVHMAEIATKGDPKAIIISVDTWLGSPEHWNPNRPDNIFLSLKLKNGYPGIYYQFLANVMWKGLENNIIPLPQTSTNAAIMLKRLGVQADLIHLDAGHDFENVYSDLMNYWDLLAEGGVLIGDDFIHAWPGVKSAVKQFCSERNLKFVADFPKYFIYKNNAIKEEQME
ncbi:MAG: class I SAM-dependent methyltransferase [Xenococcus sp. (in: cyanobacteria)]